MLLFFPFQSSVAPNRLLLLQYLVSWQTGQERLWLRS